ncbi:MAG TPA: zinc-ribbon domain-containing protein [Clostridia bacterium]|jgi:TM2 domain-containing membrane protein YozV
MALEALKCPNCGAPLEPNQNFCDHCGVGLKSTDTENKGRGFNISIQGKDKTYTYGFSFDTQPNQSGQGTYNQQGAYNNTYNSHINTYANGPQKATSGLSKEIALVLALISLFCLGGIAIHKIYLKRIGAFVLSILFVWTFIPVLMCLINCITLATMSEQDFQAQYCK